MKISYRAKSLVFALGAALAFGSVTARADDEKPVRHHHHAAKARAERIEKAETANRNDHSTKLPGKATIPTRDDRNSLETPGGRTGGANGPEYRVPTGSQLPHRYNRKGYSTDDDRNSFILDKNDQRIQSRNSVGETLRTVPGVTVRGARGL